MTVDGPKRVHVCVGEVGVLQGTPVFKAPSLNKKAQLDLLGW